MLLTLFVQVYLWCILIFHKLHDIKISFLNVGSFQKLVKHSCLIQKFLFIFQEVAGISLYLNYNMCRKVLGIHTETLCDVLPKFMNHLHPQVFTLIQYFKLIFKLLLITFNSIYFNYYYFRKDFFLNLIKID